MADTEFDVIIAAYLIPDLAQDDFDAMVRLAGDKQLEVEGIALVNVAPDGVPSVQETGDHLGRKGLTIGGGAKQLQGRPRASPEGDGRRLKNPATTVPAAQGARHSVVWLPGPVSGAGPPTGVRPRARYPVPAPSWRILRSGT